MAIHGAFEPISCRQLRFLGLKERPQARTATYFTDAAALRRAYGGPPTVILGPGEAAMAHQTDEYCYVNKLEASVPMYADIMAKWCAI